MSNVVRCRSAHKLFDKVTKRRQASQTSPNCKANISLCRKRLNLVDPFEYFNQNDLPKSWTSKISSLVREYRPQEAMGLFKAMLVNEQRPNFVTVLSVIRAVGLLGSKNLVCGIHGYSIKMGLIDSQVSIVTALIGVYSNWDMGSAWKLFNRTPNKDVVLCSAMVLACVSNEEYLEAFKLVKEMMLFDIQPNHVTISSILPACADLAALKLGREIHGYSIKRPLYCHTSCQNSLMDMYSKCRNLESALQVFRHMENKDIISWRIMIHGSVENEIPEKALLLFLELLACSVKGVDECIIQDVLGAYSQLDENHIREGLHSLVFKMGFTAFISVMTELLQVYVKFGDIDSARNIFDQLKYKDFIAWSSMIAVYAQSTQPKNAFDILREMQLADQKPNEFTFVSLLMACTSLDAKEIGESIHAQITKDGHSTNAFLTSALIDMYCKLGRTSEGKAVFDENPSKDLICWSSMINGYGINGCGEEALHCFSNMLSYGIEPNDVVFISLLSACSHCGLEYEGWNWFHAMESMYGVKPKLAHYACMVDMLSRQGNIEEALEFVNNMPIEPDRRIWGALLAGCRNIHGPTEILEIVAKKLISLDPENTSYYVVLSNLYADQGRWEEVEKLRNMIDTKPLKKVMAYSTI
ncbi:pentatricopeptide repeat-containing protein At4g14170 isoform X1 [Sesamum indicum]|uniref:Pentatricopeptide repeat-containing protein At4g14170 isoform X1 n=2 Tax=Sesamum indicum TaxID=4182 RepID=A0A6I9U3V4_SESIN|nr:pentatricopeptide repeat-containing protein At4g14170 isoform X1 [Sesamum indicum]XP_011092267.1 pentatricopeptide repeat-containing protein At4g14170 isoform X1 [Sesamum indicum]XP_011092276.1 pentatricopeptide repeat-containing protein At4g14170 isoform X1 [Sesamum indicum]